MTLTLRGAFADPGFRRLLAGQSLSGFGDTALYLTLPIWAKNLTGSNAAAGAVFLALGIPALFGPVAGHMADRVARRPLAICVNALTAALVLALFAVRSSHQLWIIYLVTFGYGVAGRIVSSANSGLRKDMLAGKDLASANAAMQSISQGVRIVAPLAGAGLYTAFGGGAVAAMDAVTFAAAIAALASIRVRESQPEAAARGEFWREVSAGFRHIRTVALLRQITLVTAAVFAVIGLNETVIFAVIGQGLHKAPSFFGVVCAVQGAGSIAAGATMTVLLRRIGSARMVGLSLAALASAGLAYLTSSVASVLAGAFADGIGVVWLTAVSVSALQLYSPARLQGRVSAAWTTSIITPQTLSIAAGTAAISHVSYRLLLLAVIAVPAAGALLLIARPAAEPAAEPRPRPESEDDRPPVTVEAMVPELDG